MPRTGSTEFPTSTITLTQFWGYPKLVTGLYNLKIQACLVNFHPNTQFLTWKVKIQKSTTSNSIRYWSKSIKTSEIKIWYPHNTNDATPGETIPNVGLQFSRKTKLWRGKNRPRRAARRSPRYVGQRAAGINKSLPARALRRRAARRESRPTDARAHVARFSPRCGVFLSVSFLLLLFFCV